MFCKNKNKNLSFWVDGLVSWRVNRLTSWQGCEVVSLMGVVSWQVNKLTGWQGCEVVRLMGWWGCEVVSLCVYNIVSSSSLRVHQAYELSSNRIGFGLRYPPQACPSGLRMPSWRNSLCAQSPLHGGCRGANTLYCNWSFGPVDETSTTFLKSNSVWQQQVYRQKS